jgi:hypothetical protein
VRIEQALYGATKGGHSIVEASGDAVVARELTSRLDLPDTAPYGVEWSPFLTGFPYGDHYVLGRVISDDQALRGGMVFTHALIVSLNDMAGVNDLQSLIDLLCNAPSPEMSITTLEVPAGLLPARQASAEQLAIATMLVSSTKRPIVRLGHEGFDQIVAQLWNKLWPSIRRGFAFRLSFGPGDLVEQPLPTLVCTPSNLASRWSGYQMVGPHPGQPGQTALSPAAAVLVGAPEGREVLDFATSLGVEISAIQELILVERLYALHRTAEAGLDKSTAQLRLLEALCAGQPSVAEGREKIIRDVLRELPGATASQIRALRNMVLTSVDRPARIWDAVREWMRNYRFPSSEDTAAAELTRDVGEIGRAVSDWQTAVSDGLRFAKSQRSSGFGGAFWRWGTTISADMYSRACQGFALVPGDEIALIKDAPEAIKSGVGQGLLALSVSRGLYRLHGIVASMIFDPLEAIRSQLAVERSPDSAEGILLALRKAAPKQLVECALAFHDPRLEELAANAASLEPSVFAEMDLREQTAQNIWQAAIERNQACWRGPSEPMSVFEMILDQMLDERKSETSLIAVLSSTPLANLSKYSRRPELWGSLTATTKQRLLTATSKGWLDEVAKSKGSPVEMELQSHILNSPTFTATVREFTAQNINSALKLLFLLTSLDERRLLSLLPILTSRQLASSDAEHLGRLITERQWSHAAEELANLSRHGRDDIRPALRICHGLLSFWTLLRIGIAPLSADEKWQALEQIAIDLYPSGPDHNDLWRRSGGNNADLQHYGDGRARWSDALFKIRRGYSLRVWTLLGKMREEYNWNDDLRYLSHDQEFQERR